MTYAYYRVSWPCDTAVFATAFLAAAPRNNLSVTLNVAGDEAIIKAPAGLSSPAVLEVYDTAPVDLVLTPAWRIE